jgi:3D (Asp-Asp-Asp) domain-containing protein
MSVERGPSQQCCRGLAAALTILALTAASCTRRTPPTPPPAPAHDRGSVMQFTATAYCKGSVTATGTRPTEGIVAADPALLPFGTKVRLTGLDARYDGVYTVRDTGGSIRGRRIDLFIRDCREAVRFGRRSTRVAVVR